MRDTSSTFIIATSTTTFSDHVGILLTKKSNTLAAISVRCSRAYFTPALNDPLLEIVSAEMCPGLTAYGAGHTYSPHGPIVTGSVKLWRVYCRPARNAAESPLRWIAASASKSLCVSLITGVPSAISASRISTTTSSSISIGSFIPSTVHCTTVRIARFASRAPWH